MLVRKTNAEIQNTKAPIVPVDQDCSRLHCLRCFFFFLVLQSMCKQNLLKLIARQVDCHSKDQVTQLDFSFFSLSLMNQFLSFISKISTRARLCA